MMTPASAQVTAPIAEAIPWYFAIVLVVAGAAVGMLAAQGVRFLIDLRRDLRGETIEEESSLGAVFATLGFGLVTAVAAGIVAVPVWYLMHPEQQPPEVTAAAVRSEFVELGADRLQSRDTEPRHSLARIDPQAWADGRILERLLACDAGQFPEAGSFPAYEGYDWQIPVESSAGDGILTRVVADGECTFTLTPVG